MSENKRVFCKETRLFHKLKIVDRSGKTASAKKPRAILSTPKSARNYVKYAKNGRRHSPPPARWGPPPEAVRLRRVKRNISVSTHAPARGATKSLHI